MEIGSFVFLLLLFSQNGAIKGCNMTAEGEREKCLWRGLRSRGRRVVKWLASKLDLGWRAERVPLNKSTICVESTLFPWIEGRAEFMIPFFCVETTAAFCKNRLAES